MADRAGFKVTGLREVVRDLQRIGLDVDDLKGAFSRIAAEGARVASGFVRSRSGALAGSVRGNRAKSKAVVAAGSARAVPYSGVQNYGWPARHIPAQGFMQRADDVMRTRAIGMLEDEVNTVIRRRGLT